MVAQLVKKSPPLLEPEGSYRILNRPPLVCILNRMNPVHNITPYFFEIRLCLDLSSGTLPSGLPAKILY